MFRAIGARVRHQKFLIHSLQPTRLLHRKIVPIRSCASRPDRLIPLALMVHHVVLYKLKPEVTPARVEEMMMNSRMQLLKIPEVLSIKCGKRIDSKMAWPFFIALDFESMDKYAIFREDPIFVKFEAEIIKPNTSESLVLDFEMDPGKDVRFS
jgi:Stress responsive A/B Barrel Domain